MTKKSLARQQRDEVAKNSQQAGIKSLYATLEEMYQQQRGMFAQYGKMIHLINHDEIVPFHQDPERITVLLKGMSADIDDLLTKTDALYAQHQGKAGWPDPRDEDEHYNIMQLQHTYIVYMGVHQQNLLPVLFELDEHLNRALDAKRELQNQAVGAATSLNEPAPAVLETIHINGQTVRADGQGWTTENMHEATLPRVAVAPTDNPYEAPAIDVGGQ